MLSLQIVTFVGGKISVPVWCFFQETCLQFTFRETSGTHQPDAEMSMFLKCKRIGHRLCKLFRIFPIASMLPYKQRTESLVDSWSSRHIGVYVSANFPLLPPFSTQNIDLFVKVSRMNMAFLSVFVFFFFFIHFELWFKQFLPLYIRTVPWNSAMQGDIWSRLRPHSFYLWICCIRLNLYVFFITIAESTSSSTTASYDMGQCIGPL